IDDDVLRGDFLGFAILALDADRCWRSQRAPTLDGVDLVLAEQKLDALVVLVDDVTRALHRLAVVVANVPDVNAKLGRLLDCSGTRGRLGEGLGGDAAALATGAPAGVLLSGANPHAKLGRPDRGNVPASPATQK